MIEKLKKLLLENCIDSCATSLASLIKSLKNSTFPFLVLMFVMRPNGTKNCSKDLFLSFIKNFK